MNAEVQYIAVICLNRSEFDSFCLEKTNEAIKKGELEQYIIKFSDRLQIGRNVYFEASNIYVIRGRRFVDYICYGNWFERNDITDMRERLGENCQRKVEFS